MNERNLGEVRPFTDRNERTTSIQTFLSHIYAFAVSQDLLLLKVLSVVLLHPWTTCRSEDANLWDSKDKLIKAFQSLHHSHSSLFLIYLPRRFIMDLRYHVLVLVFSTLLVLAAPSTIGESCWCSLTCWLKWVPLNYLHELRWVENIFKTDLSNPFFVFYFWFSVGRRVFVCMCVCL